MCNGDKLMSELTVPPTPVYVLTGAVLTDNGEFVLDASTSIADLMDRFNAEILNRVYDALSIQCYPDRETGAVLSYVAGYPMYYDAEVLGVKD